MKAMAKQNLNNYEFFGTKFLQPRGKEGIFVGSQNQKVSENPEFEITINILILRAWHSF